MSIQRLEDLKVWQEARILMKAVYNITNNFPKSEEYNLKRHMRECARNVTGNIAEGFGRYHFQESIQFYRIARGSLAELKSDTYSSFDLSYFSDADFKGAVEQEDKVVKMLNALIESTMKLKKSN
jgi:four helix bundle protein